MPEKWKEVFSKINFWQLLLVFVAGFALVFLSLPQNKEKQVPQNTVVSEQNELEYEEKLEQRLEAILSNVEGIGEVEVIITLKASSQVVLNKDIKSSISDVNEVGQNGTNKSSKEEQYEENTILSGEEPYIIQEYAPIIEGILVIAEGGGSSKVQEEINDALTALFDLAPHKIKVLKKKTGEIP